MSSFQSASVSGVDSRRVVSGQEAAHLLAQLLREQPRHADRDRFERVVRGPLQTRVQPITTTIREAGHDLGDVARHAGQGVGAMTEAGMRLVVQNTAEGAGFAIKVAGIASDTWAKLTVAANESVQHACENTLHQIEAGKEGALGFVRSVARMPVVAGNLTGNTIEGSADLWANGIDSTAWVGDALLIKTSDGTGFVIENAAKLLNEASSLAGGVWDLSRLLAQKAGNVAGRVVYTGANVLADILDGAGNVAERAGRQANEFGDELADVVRSRRLSAVQEEEV